MNGPLEGGGVGDGTGSHGIVEPSSEKGSLRPLGGPLRMSLRAAIDAKCRECGYDAKCGAGTWREQVEACPATTCPLYPVRPRPKAAA